MIPQIEIDSYCCLGQICCVENARVNIIFRQIEYTHCNTELRTHLEKLLQIAYCL